ncbi:MAG TPA: phytanoyl-CoA dioxygenase family protein, partial [Pyrinomonadaceae bacterium]|nr:phytanoyl-CoA dioxygenase family protein [Pyrinomonadaceae bacterium]
ETAILRSLETDGIAVTTIQDLLGEDHRYESLVSETAALLDARAGEIDELRLAANDDLSIGKKTFNLELFGSEFSVDSADAFLRFALNEGFLRIANAYLKMTAKLRYYNVWLTFASSGSARESQLWHFDREDRCILKMFLYLDEVDQGTGPFTYAPGTHLRGKDRGVRPEFFIEGGVRRTSDAQMGAVIPEERWIRGTGRRGTLIFADTRGYHKGGEARTKDRLMFTCMYTSPASESRDLIEFSDGFDPSELTADQVRALGIK